MPKPLITILLPAYNAEKFIRGAVESILAQSYGNFELLIINDGSTDNTVSIVESIKDPRIRLVHNERNMGLIATLNRGLDRIETPYMARMDADDLSHPRRLQKQLDFMEKNPDIGISSCWFETIGGNEKQVSRYGEEDKAIRFNTLYQNHLCHAAAIFRMDVMNRHQLRFDPKYQHAEDYELWSRALRHTRLANIPEVLYTVRSHGGSVSKQHRQIQLQNSVKVKINLFSSMGVEADASDAGLFTRLCYQDYPREVERIIQAEGILNRMIRGNAETNYLPAAYLSHRLGRLWFNLCYHNAHMGRQAIRIFRHSPLSAHAGAGALEMLKFKAKAILKR